MAPEAPRRMIANGKKFPDEWNKIVAVISELMALGAFDLVDAPKSVRIAPMKLQGAMYAGMEGGKQTGRIVRREDDDWTELSPAVEYDIYPDFSRGFFFAGDLVAARSVGSKWYAIGAGHFCVRAKLSATLSAGGTAAAVADDLPGDPAMSVTDYAMAGGQSIASGKIFQVNWDSGLAKWVLPGPKCADVAG